MDLFGFINSKMCANGATSEIGWKYEFTFQVILKEKYSFRFGTDFDYGGWIFFLLLLLVIL